MSRIKPFRKIQTTDKDMNLLQDQLKEILDALLKNPIAGSNTVPSVKLAAGDNLVPHGLGRNWVSCFAALPSAVASLSLSAVQKDRTQWVNVTASAPCVATFLVT